METEKRLCKLPRINVSGNRNNCALEKPIRGLLAANLYNLVALFEVFKYGVLGEGGGGGGGGFR